MRLIHLPMRRPFNPFALQPEGPSYNLYPAASEFKFYNYGLTVHTCFDMLLAVEQGTLFQDSGLATQAVAESDPIGGFLPPTLQNGTAYGETATQTYTTNGGTNSDDKRGILKLTQFNGNLPCVRFAGTSRSGQFLRTPGTGPGATIAQPFVVLMAYQWVSRNATAAQIMDSVNATNRCQYKSNGAGYTRQMVAGGTAQSVGSMGTSIEVVAMLFNGASSKFNVNGSAVNPGATPGANSLQGITLGESRSAAMTDSAGSSPANIDLHFFGVLTSAGAWGDTELNTLVSDFKTARGL